LVRGTLVAARSRLTRKLISLSAASLALLGIGSSIADAQLSTFAGNAQHTNVYSTSAEVFNKIKWSTTIDDSASGAFAHYGQMLITPSNTVFVFKLSPGMTFQIEAFDGATGTLKYTQNTDYVLPSASWVPSYQPVITNGPSGKRLYYPGKGGTIYYIDNIDSNSPSSPTQLAFYGLSNYTANQAGFDGSVFIDTPMTADSNGNLFFGFRTQGTAPFPSGSTGKSGWARISSTGVGSFVTVDAMTSDSNMTYDQHNLAPALSNDESTVYVVAKSTGITSAYLVGLDTTTLATKYKVAVQDPRPTPGVIWINDVSTSSPMVGPDGDVYWGILLNSPYNGSRGALMHYSGDLSVTKTPGAFGWDYTPGVVPSSMVPGYTGTSSYLLCCKYNNYYYLDGNGVNTIGILDPNDNTEVDTHANASGLVCMREVLTVIGNTPDGTSSDPRDIVREWCVNATAVDTATGTVVINSEDGYAYRWDLAHNSLSEVLSLSPGFGQPYVPQAIGPDGTAYTLNGTFLFAMGQDPGVKVTLDSSAPDNRYSVSGDSITFTAKVTGGSGSPTGTVTFTDNWYNDRTLQSQTLQSNVALVGGQAQCTTTALTSDLTGANVHFGSHWVTATYNGDGTHPIASATRIQKIHSNASTTVASVSTSPSPYGQPVVLGATVSSVPVASGTPTMQCAIADASNGNKVLGQMALDGSSHMQVTVSNLTPGTHQIIGIYNGDTQFAASTSAPQALVIQGLTAFTVSPSTVIGGNSVTGTVTIAAAAGVGGETVTISSNSANATVPANVVVPQGQTTANFTITTSNSAGSNASATITCTDGVAKTQVITINPANQASFISQSVVTTMHPGHSYPVSLVFKNTGTTTWTTALGYKLQSKSPTDNTIWGMTRIPMSTPSVAPNANATFAATVAAPTTPGFYNFQWQPIEDSASQSFGPTSTLLSVSVSVLANDAVFITRTGATGVYANSDFYAQYTMKNVGSSSWSQAAGYSMMSINPANNTTFGINRLNIPASSTVTQNQQVTCVGLCHAPATPGTYPMQWQMNKSGVAFGDATPIQTITVYAAPNNAQFISQTVPTSVGPSKTFSATFNFKNTGSATWTVAGGYGIKSQNPAGNTTFGTATVAVPGNVAPNATATIVHAFTAPATPGTYHFQWKMAQNGNSFGDFGTDVVITVSADAAVYVSRSGATTIYAGADFYSQYTMQNVGTTTWTQATGYSMMSVNPANNTVWRINRLTIPAASTVTPGATVVATGLCTAPTTPGTYTMQWQMNKSGVAFGAQTPVQSMTVVNGADNATFVSQTGIPTTIVHGTTFNASIVMKNTGTGTWNTAGGYSLKSQNPLGNTNWGAATRAVTGSVAPNANATFSGVFTAPAAPGTYHFQWRMLHNTTNFGAFTTDVTITVT